MTKFPVTVLVFCSLLTVGQCLPSPRRTKNDQCQRYMDVAVVGAGPAGAYSAYRLKDDGLNIEVFEYSDRVGGRLYTSTLPDTKDVNIELGGMRFYAEAHTRVMQIVKELGLTSRLLINNYDNTTDSRYFLRGKSYLPEVLNSGDIPYRLSPEEKANQGRIFSYYLEKLTGFNGSYVDENILLQLKVADGRYLYTIPIDEALSMVATKEGLEFMRGLDQFESDFARDTSSLSFLENNIGPYNGDHPVLTLKEGMSSIPKGLMKVFLKTSSRHRLNMNRQLLSISRADAKTYRLVLQATKTANDITTPLPITEAVCAKRIILALPRLALSQIRWSPLSDERVKDAINAVRDVKVVKVFISFPTRWWVDNATNPALKTYSDLSFAQFFDWGRSNATGHYLILASYADESRAKLLTKLNSGGTNFNGSPVGAHRVNKEVLDTLLDDLAKAYGADRVNIPEPVSTMIQSWGSSYPFGGGWVVWKYGYRYDDVIAAVQRPSLTDDVFYVGADHARGYHVGWTEGAFETVDRVIDLYFK